MSSSQLPAVRSQSGAPGGRTAAGQPGGATYEGMAGSLAQFRTPVLVDRSAGNERQPHLTVGYSTLRSTRQMLCQVPSASRPWSTGTVAYGGTSAGITWDR